MNPLQQAASSDNHFRLIPGFGVPVLVTIMGVLAKKLVAAKPWEREHFYMGAEMTLAALAAAIVNFTDLVKPDAATPSNYKMLVGADAMAAVVCFLLLMLVLSLHQDWEPRVKLRPKLSFFWLICVSNLIGFGLLALVIILVPVT